MNIYVLEDDYSQQNHLKSIIESFISNHKLVDARLFLTAKPNEILERIENKVGYNIYFLDIEIKRSTNSGFELAKLIRQIDPFGWLVFVTTHSEFLPLTFKQKLTALDFIDKTQNEEDFIQSINECLEIALNKKSSSVSEDAFIFKNQHSDFQVPFADILYFETTEITHKVRMVSKNKFSEFYANLNEIEPLDKRLYKCHRSFVVNLTNIERIDRTNHIVHLVNNKKILVARTKISSLQRKLKDLQS